MGNVSLGTHLKDMVQVYRFEQTIGYSVTFAIGMMSCFPVT